VIRSYLNRLAVKSRTTRIGPIATILLHNVLYAGAHRRSGRDVNGS
jgi:hypothetical protein